MMNLKNEFFSIENNIIKGRRTDCEEGRRHIGKRILEALTKTPKAINQIDDKNHTKTTCEEMKDRSIRCALWLRQQGIGAEDVIAYCTPFHSTAYIPILATFYVGAVCNPWHHEVPLKTAKDLLNLARPKIMFVCDSALEVLVQAARDENIIIKFVTFGSSAGFESLNDLLMKQNAHEVTNFQVTELMSPQQTATIHFSSGTTGFPKGVQMTYEAVQKRMSSKYRGGIYSVLLYPFSIYWISGMQCLILAILRYSINIVNASEDIEEICKTIEKYKVTLLIAPYYLMIKFHNSPEIVKRYDMSSLRYISASGAKFDPKIFQDMEKRLPGTFTFQCYGMTETSGMIVSQFEDRKRIDSIGIVCPNVEMKFANVATGEALGPNLEGEICIKSPYLMKGYIKNPEANREIFDSDGWLRSGDMGYYDENGEIFISDRIKQIIKFRNHHISPFEIQETLMTHPGVEIAAIVPVSVDDDGERPVAFVEKVHGATVTEEELIEFSAVLGEHKKLWRVKFIEQMPYTATGKISIGVLKDMAKLHLNDGTNKQEEFHN